MDTYPTRERLLVPIDGSEPSRAALREAIVLARCLKARLRLLHVLDPRLLLPQAMTGVAPEQLIERQAAEGSRLLDDALAQARAADVEADTVLRTDPPARVSDLILEEVRQWPADLVVMGTHGRHGLSRLVMGSDAESVLHASPVPVLLTRAGAGR